MNQPPYGGPPGGGYGGPPPGGYGGPPPGGYGAPPGGYGPPGSPPGYGGMPPQSPYIAPAPGYSPMQQVPAVGMPQGQTTHTLAVISLVCSIVACIPFGPIIAIVTGFLARSAIQREPERYTGAGMALAGIIIGFAWIAIGVLWFLFAVLLAAASS